jgi:hypothetical protein
MSSLPHFLDNRLTGNSEIVNLRVGRLLLLRKIPRINIC